MRRPIDQTLEWAAEAGWNQAELARRLGASSADITNWKARGLPPSRHAEVARLFGRTVDQLLGLSPTLSTRKPEHGTVDDNIEDARKLRAAESVPIVGTIQGGDNGFLEELGYSAGTGDGRVPYYGRDPNAYALRVRGDSMADRIMSGDRIIVEPNTSPLPGDIAVFLLKDGRKTVKQLLYIRDGEATLASFNRDHPSMLISIEEIDQMHKVVGILPR